MPACQYLGIDANPHYIRFAQKYFGTKGQFIEGNITHLKSILSELNLGANSFDIIIINCVIHHLSDSETHAVLTDVQWALKPEGRFISMDGCYLEKQSPIARYLLKADRGQFVRTDKDYVKLISRFFPKYKTSLRNDLLWVPYTMIVMECGL